ncbi:MAG: hypothetical protein IKI64_11050 [Clostridia bacterium]|nr:hypothetical protein [Clostridia bacterium]
MQAVFSPVITDIDANLTAETGSKSRTQSVSGAEALVCAFPPRCRSVLAALLNGQDAPFGAIEEIRFRLGSPVQLVAARGEIMLSQYGVLTATEAEAMLGAVCENSVYSKENELVRGFVTLPGGVRVGICGEPIEQGGRIVRFTRVSGFCFRLPRQLKGCAEALAARFTQNGSPVSCLVAARPGVGKTTFLRDLARCLSNGIGVERAFKVALADERSELSGGVFGAGALDVGLRTDVMAGVPKAVSMPLLIRNMSPQIIVTDELDGEAELACAAEAAKCGVAVIASVHAANERELLEKAGMRRLVESGIMRTAMLERASGRFTLRTSQARGG